MSYIIKFSLNHMVHPSCDARELITAAAKLGIKAIELRNDIQANSINDLQQATEIGALAKENGIEILSINALYPFNIWNEERATQADNLAQLAQACGAKGLVLCPLNESSYQATEETKSENLRIALQALDAVLGQYHLYGFVEPLGFPASSLRLKRTAADVIQALSLESRFGLVHDTFHHRGGGEQEMFANITRLVHISGVEDPDVSFDVMQDAHRILVGPGDRLDNIRQIRQLLANGYNGYFSFEPFSRAVWDLPDPFAAVKKSMDYISSQL
ncbi:TIM barrel protein [Gynuella sunshinyii]|uniref:Putative sugar epimerase n=1 Tax=Gynuella sunshinyii YC6258 TaxID=1445510 RepID=A0A0C5VT59_9GAMM|nr:TIM barrel protein [Gynuella sunshinyii]AJQ97371.1 putative sugar epimerase [Gynuella sunshinyii YC6258]